MCNEKMIDDDTAEDWESGKYGRDANHVRKCSIKEQQEIEKILGITRQNNKTAILNEEK